MASPFPNFEVGDKVDVSLPEGGFLNDWIITYIPNNSPGMNSSSFFWELEDPTTGDHVIVSQFSIIRKKA